MRTADLGGSQNIETRTAQGKLRIVVIRNDYSDYPWGDNRVIVILSDLEHL